MKKKKQSTAKPVEIPPVAAEPVARRPVVRIVITEDNGEVRVDGPVGDKILTYGLLLLATDAVRDGKLIQ